MKKLLLILGFAAMAAGITSCSCTNCVNCDNSTTYDSSYNVCKTTYEASGASAIMSWQAYSDQLKNGGCTCN